MSSTIIIYPYFERIVRAPTWKCKSRQQTHKQRVTPPWQPGKSMWNEFWHIVQGVHPMNE